MAYSGTTAATTSRNPVRLIADGALYGRVGQSTGLTSAPTEPGAQGMRFWGLCSTNKTTDITVANFVSDGYNAGMKPGDLLFHVQFTSAGSSVIVTVHPITGVTTSGASLSAGSAGYLSSTRGTSI